MTSPAGTHAPNNEPLDLRLVPPAVAAWLTAAVFAKVPMRTALLVATIGFGLALLLLILVGSGLARSCAAVLICAAAAAVASSCHFADLRRGPLPELGREHARAVVTLTITGDPSRKQSRVRGSAQEPPMVIVSGTARRVTAAGRTTRLRSPLLLVVRGEGADRWLPLLPSAQVTADAEVVAPTDSNDQFSAVLYVRGPPRNVQEPNMLQRVAGHLRAGLRTASAGLTEDARALLPALVVGDGSRISPELAEDFDATDLSHLLAVSGGNLTILLVVLIGPPSRAIRAERGGLAARIGLSLRISALVGGLLIIGFVVLCRPDPSVLRAAACGLVTVFAIGTGRRRSMMPALASAVLFLVLFFPGLANSYGFVLSVLATGALLVMAPRWSAALRRHGLPDRLAELAASAAAAQVVCAPVLVLLSAEVSLIAVPCNMLAELAVAPATVLGFAALVTAPLVPPVAQGFAWLGGWPTQWVAAIARAGAALPGAQITWLPGWAGAAALAATVGVALPLLRLLVRRPVVSMALVLVLLVFVLKPPPLVRLVTGWPPRGWYLVACDVGQGDALVLSAGGGSAVVVDAGPDAHAIDDCLRRLDITRIPLLVLTHFHADHVAGLAGVLHGRSVGAIETSPRAVPAAQQARVQQQARAAGIKVVEAALGERRSVGPLSWEVLWPPLSTPEGFSTSEASGMSGEADENPNNASVVMLFHIAGVRVLLLGDLEAEAQRQLLNTHPELSAVDVIKVAHHGSSSQDLDLLHRLSPHLALVSSGRHNPYGHPAPRTLAALRFAGVAVVRTDVQGSIAVLGGAPTLRVSAQRTIHDGR